MPTQDDWEDEAFLQTTLENQVRLLIPDLAALYLQAGERADRNYAAEQIVHARVKPTLPRGWRMFFSADCPDSGHCRFQMRVTRRPEDMEVERPVFFDHNMNFMKPHDEWVIKPAQME